MTDLPEWATERPVSIVSEDEEFGEFVVGYKDNGPGHVPICQTSEKEIAEEIVKIWNEKYHARVS